MKTSAKLLCIGIGMVWLSTPGKNQALTLSLLDTVPTSVTLMVLGFILSTFSFLGRQISQEG